MVAFEITFFGTREKTEFFQRSPEAGEPKISLKARIMLLVRNKYFLLAVLLFLAYYGISALSNISVYYSQYVLGDANLMGMLSLATYIPQVIGMLFIAPILSKFGKRFCCLLGLGISLLGYVICAVGATALPVLLAGLCIKNIGMVPITAALIPFVADTVEYGDWKTGHRIEGTTYSCTSFGIKVGSGLGGALMGWLLDAGGYIPNAAAQTESALFAMKGLYIYLPAILSLGLGLILYFFDVEKIYPTIEADLKARQESRSERG